ncbi:zinc-binding alcohol dehydrogenase family protein [Pedobacter psychrodurus]|uniref:zinc-binding alcohol dehydrogenase family protein n=1 Tax=Pedobacter psychrodurus TaxID=2530456 RepID=UPI00292D859F|nr:zinc-binding alcohol dehydrogenase family protein [Pedobacter psychrodurus]
MKAIVLQQPGKFETILKPMPNQPGKGEVLMKVKNISICGTDLHAYRGKQPFFSYPRILGHEIAAEVVAIGEGITHLKPGDLCSIEPYRNAMIDQAVRRGRATCGSQLTVLGVHEDGALQEYFIYAGENVHEANGLTPDQVAIVEPFAIGSHAVERAEVTAEDIVLVVGIGPIGIAAIAMADLKGAKLIALDLNKHRLGYIKENYPAVQTILLSENVINDIQNLLGNDLPTVVIDASGNKNSMEKSFDYAAAGGTIVFVGLFQGDVVFNDPNFHRKELNVKASRAATSEDFRKVIAGFKSGVINTSGYITHRIAFNDLVDEFERLYLPEENVIKAIIDF